jgi:hypothetical protein
LLRLLCGGNLEVHSCNPTAKIRECVGGSYKVFATVKVCDAHKSALSNMTRIKSKNVLNTVVYDKMLTVSLASNPTKKYAVEVLLVTKNIDDTRAGLVHCHFENPNHELLPGMFLSGNFDLSAKPTSVVPEDAVVRFEGKEYVFIAKDSQLFEMLEVQTGTKQNGMVSLKPNSGLDFTKTKLVTKNSYRLLGMLKNKAE